MRGTIAFVALILPGLQSVAIAQETIPADVLQRVKQASVFVKVSLGPLDYSGSGFVIQTDAESVYLVTNAHVVAKPDLKIDGLPPGLRGRDALELRRVQAAIQNLEPVVSVVFNSGTADEQVVSPQIVVIDAKRDLAILKAVKVKSVPTPISLDLRFRPTETTTVFSFGFPFGEALSNSKGNPAITVSRGAISSVRLEKNGEDETIQIDGALNPGNSGGAVVDVQGRLVGVANAGIRGSGIGFAIPPAILHRMLNGTAGQAEFFPRKVKDEYEIEVKLSLLDPFQKIREADAICTLADVVKPVPEATKRLEGTRIDLKIEKGKAKGSWRVAAPKGKSAILLQVVLTDADGQEHHLPTTSHPWNESGSSQARNPRRRGPFSLQRPTLDDEVRKSIVTQLARKDSTAIRQALQELSQFDPEEDEHDIATELEKLLSHTDDSIRTQATRLIGIWGLKDNAAEILKLLEDSVAGVRHAAMESLATLQFMDAVEPIVERLYETADRQLAKQALIRLGSGAEEAVLKCLNVNELPVRVVACEILAEIGSTETAVPALKKLAESEKGLIATRAREAIQLIEGRAAAPSGSRLIGNAGGSRKVHVGLPIKQANMLLTEGAIVLSDRGPAIGMGIVQTGDETMEFTYLTLTRLPKSNTSKATFSSRKKILKDRVRVTHAIYLGDDEVSIEHLYATDKLPFVAEEFVMYENTFDPKNGRIFLVDLSGPAPVVVQKQIHLPAAGSLVEIDDEVVLNLADQAINDLLKSDEDVRGFMNGAKLAEASKTE